MLKNLFRSSACLLLIMTFGASLVEAQMRSASIAGTVLDAAGGVVPNADVVVTEQSTNVSTPTKSTAAGEERPRVRSGLMAVSGPLCPTTNFRGEILSL